MLYVDTVLSIKYFLKSTKVHFFNIRSQDRCWVCNSSFYCFSRKFSDEQVQHSLV